MPSARLLLEKWKMCLVEHISPVPPPAHPASEDFSYWPSQGRALNRQWRWRQHWCTDLLLESVHDYHPAFPQASFGMRELEILWRKQRAGDSSPKALQTYVPVLSQFFASFTLPLRTSRSLGGRNQVSSKRLISHSLMLDVTWSVLRAPSHVTGCCSCWHKPQVPSSCWVFPYCVLQISPASCLSACL